MSGSSSTTRIFAARVGRPACTSAAKAAASSRADGKRWAGLGGAGRARRRRPASGAQLGHQAGGRRGRAGRRRCAARSTASAEKGNWPVSGPVEHHGQRPEIAAVIQAGLAPHLLGAHVARACPPARPCRSAGEPCGAASAAAPARSRAPSPPPRRRCGRRKRLAGLRSRWMMPAACAAARARAIWLSSEATAARAPAAAPLSRASRSSPSSSSMTM